MGKHMYIQSGHKHFPPERERESSSKLVFIACSCMHVLCVGYRSLTTGNKVLKKCSGT